MSLRIYQRTGGTVEEITPALALGDNLARAVVISLFSDRRAEPDDALPDTPPQTPPREQGGAFAANRRGWWADAFAERPIGSRLWLLARSKATTATLNAAREFAQEALGWLVDEGHAAAVEVAAEIPRQGWLVLTVTIERPEGRETFAFETELEAA